VADIAATIQLTDEQERMGLTAEKLALARLRVGADLDAKASRGELLQQNRDRLRAEDEAGCE
jgi:hypothetical protein